MIYELPRRRLGLGFQRTCSHSPFISGSLEGVCMRVIRQGDWQSGLTVCFCVSSGRHQHHNIILLWYAQFMVFWLVLIRDPGLRTSPIRNAHFWNLPVEAGYEPRSAAGCTTLIHHAVVWTRQKMKECWPSKASSQKSHSRVANRKSHAERGSGFNGS